MGVLFASLGMVERFVVRFERGLVCSDGLCDGRRRGLRLFPALGDVMPETVNEIVTLLAFGIAIGANNFTVALTLGGMGQRKRQGRILLAFGVFEFFVPLIGVWLGQQASKTFADQASWIGPTLLALLGLVTIFTARRSRKDRQALARTVTSWLGLIILSAGLSIDNLIVGFGLGLGGISPLALATTIACCSVSFAWLGLLVGHRVHKNYEVAGNLTTGVLLLVLAGATLAGWI